MKKLLLLAFVLANIKVSATGVCLTCPTGSDCTDGTSSIMGGSVGQVLISDGSKMVWKNVEDINLRGPQGATGAVGATGARGATGPQGDPGCAYTPVQFECRSGDCYCRLAGQNNCSSGWVSVNYESHGCSVDSNSCCNGYCGSGCDSWRSSVVGW